jgi:ribosomal protein L35AE/L33A
MSRVVVVLLTMILLCSVTAQGASLDKAKALRANGLRNEAKRELVEVTFDEIQDSAAKAEALYLLGEIAVEEKMIAAARENWGKLINAYPESPFAGSARSKLELLEQLQPNTQPETTGSSYSPGTVLVAGPKEYPWAAPQIAGALGPPTTVADGSLDEAFRTARNVSAIVAVVEVALRVDVAFETGRVICYRPNGEKIWEKVVRVTYPGSEEQIARRFVDKLAVKVKGQKCP